MKVYFKFILLLILVSFFYGCSPELTKRTQRENVECIPGEACELLGRVDIYVKKGASLGTIKYGDSCIPLALPKHVTNKLDKWNGRLVKVTADTYATYYDSSVLDYKVKDRWVISSCDVGVVLYVTEISIKNLRTKKRHK